MFWLADRIRLFVHYTINIIVQNYLKTLNLWNACQIYFVECVSKVEHILSVIHYTICGAACFQFTHFPCDDWENISIYIYIYINTLSYYHHHQIRSMNYHPLFKVRSWNNGMRCMSLYMLMAVGIGTASTLKSWIWLVNGRWSPLWPKVCFNSPIHASVVT